MEIELRDLSSCMIPGDMPTARVDSSAANILFTLYLTDIGELDEDDFTTIWRMLGKIIRNRALANQRSRALATKRICHV